MVEPKTCLQCGETFQPVREAQKFCSTPCFKAYQQKLAKPKPVKQDKHPVQDSTLPEQDNETLKLKKQALKLKLKAEIAEYEGYSKNRQQQLEKELEEKNAEIEKLKQEIEKLKQEIAEYESKPYIPAETIKTIKHVPAIQLISTGTFPCNQCQQNITYLQPYYKIKGKNICQHCIKGEFKP